MVKILRHFLRHFGIGVWGMALVNVRFLGWLLSKYGDLSIYEEKYDRRYRIDTKFHINKLLLDGFYAQRIQ